MKQNYKNIKYSNIHISIADKHNVPLDLSSASVSVQCEAQSNDKDIAHFCNSALQCIREIKREQSDSFVH